MRPTVLYNVPVSALSADSKILYLKCFNSIKILPYLTVLGFSEENAHYGSLQLRKHKILPPHSVWDRLLKWTNFDSMTGEG